MQLKVTKSFSLALLACQRGDVTEAGEQYAALESARSTMLPMAGARPVDRLPGLLAHTTGDLDRAVEHFDDALAFCRAAGYQPELAWSCCDCADTLLQRPDGSTGSPRAEVPSAHPELVERRADENRQKALALLDEPLAISRELGMRPFMERVLSRKMSLQGIDVSSPETSIDAVVSAVKVELPDRRPHVGSNGTVTVMFTDIEGSTHD